MTGYIFLYAKSKFMFNKMIPQEKRMAAVIVMIGLAVASCHFSQQILPADAGSGCESGPQALTPAEFNTWFESGSVSLDGVVKPANSVLFPDIPNCSFYKWTEQMFLWLTSPAPPSYGGGGLILSSPVFFDVSLPGSDGMRQFLPHSPGLIKTFNLRTAQKGLLDLDVIRERRTLLPLEIIPPVMAPSGKQLVLDSDSNERQIDTVRIGQDNRPVFIDVNGQEIKGPRAIMQMKGDTTVPRFLEKSRRFENFDRTSLVEKIVIGKRIFFLDALGNFHETEQGQADGSVLMAQNGSLVYYAITVNNVYMLYRTMQGATVPPNTRFPLTQANLNAISAFSVANGKSPIKDSIALAIEIKSSWVEAAGLPDADKFIKMKGIIPTYDTSNPNDWVPNGTKTVELAMVGMHVVGSTGSTNPANGNQGHPELLWGTFEHVSNDPAADYTYLTTSSTNTTISQNTAGNWVFCANGAVAPFNDTHMTMGGSDGSHIVATSGHTISPSNILREFPWGLPGVNSSGNAEVIATNNIVRSLLDPNDIRRNYIQTGTTWTIFGSSPSAGNQVGTNKLSNTTMETFTQGGNCFSCHATNTTLVSHVFDETKPFF